LFLLSKKGLGKSIREDYYERAQSVNRFVIGAIVLNKSIVGAIRREIRKLASGIKVEDKEVEQILRNEVLKRDVIEGEEASKAIKKVHKMVLKATKRSKKPPKKPESEIKIPERDEQDQNAGQSLNE